MCLTVCFQKQIIYDNDRTLDCRVCPLRKRTASQTCSTCIHLRQGQNGEYCALTKMTLPKRGWCCHHNAPSYLSYYPHPLSHVDGIVLVSSAEWDEAIEDYRISYERDTSAGISLDKIEDYFNTDLFSESDWEAVESAWSDLEHLTADETGYRRVYRDHLVSFRFVPIRVGDDLVKSSGGVSGVIAWFEEIFGGKEDILLDWKNRWIVCPRRFATPAVYGVVSTKWSEEVKEDLSGLLHQLFN